MSTESNAGGAIFVSYRNVLDVEFALKLAADLKNAGVQVWVDRLDGIVVGDDWRGSIEQAINTCAAMIPIVSPDYVESVYCRNELARADDLKRPVFPVLLRPVPALRWPISIQRVQYEDFTGWRDEAVYRAQMAALLRRVRAQASGQIGPAPDIETQYLTSLIAAMESKRGVLEYVELTADAEARAEHRPQPAAEEEWGYVWLLPGAGQDPSTAGPAPTPPAQAVPERLAGVAEAVERFPRFVLLGEPGAGKTTALRRLVRDAARKRLQNPRTAPLPLLLDLPSWKDDSTPASFVRSRWPFDTDPAGPLRIGDVWLYLDGLNEMGAGAAERAGRLRQWVSAPEGPAHVVVTCRVGDYVAETLRLGALPAVVIQELERDQIRSFARNYLEERAPAFMERIVRGSAAIDDSPGLLTLARNPYMLSALVILFEHAPGGTLPRNSGALFRGLARALWEREGKRGTPGWVSFDRAEPAFAALALAMVEEDRGTAVPEGDAVAKLGSTTLLQVGESASYLTHDGGNVRFYHQLLQEYFAAVGLKNVGLGSRFHGAGYRHLPGGVRMDPLGWPSRGASKWDEVVVAYCGIVDRPGEAVSEVLKRDPALASRCVASGVLLDPETKRMTIDRLVDALRHAQFPENAAIIRAFQEWGDPDAAPGLLDVIRTSSNGQGALADPGQAAAMALGGVAGPAAIAALVEALENPFPQVRVRAVTSLAQLGDPTAAPGLIGSLWDDSSTHMYFSFSFCVREIAKEALIVIGNRWPEQVVPALLDGLKNVEPRIRYRSAEILANIGDSLATRGLTDAARYDVDERVRGAAAHALENIRKIQEIPAILARVASADAETSQQAIRILKEVPGNIATRRLVDTVAATDLPVLRAHLKEMVTRPYGDDRRTDRLIAILDSSDVRARALGLELIAELAYTSALPALERRRDELGPELVAAVDHAIVLIRERERKFRRGY